CRWWRRASVRGRQAQRLRPGEGLRGALRLHDAQDGGPAARLSRGLRRIPRETHPASEGGDAMRLRDKVAIVTGGGSGFGEGIAMRFAAEGARVVLNDIDEDAGRRVAGAIREAGGDAHYVHGDVSRGDDMGRLLAATLERQGRLDVMVYNAGVSLRNKPLLEIDEADFDRVFATNVKSIFWSARHM